ncbi:hypothetical protein [Teredinibacter sp. KSP-S5-2]|uniref:hypothetical protein n=1 Tax=Teredinibacter sp. KSP-S5-2 TaxID=3034506 RepID=UPI002934B9AD|nr:hypothetical protein [Teredinibacter sp. KSP-S5-2]WNO11580.1 hypothetical protein P5V12_10395 [Teredinibacter sp. KSP-S5-2]
MRRLLVSSLSILLTQIAFAQTPIYDPDAQANRTTIYNNGPVAKIHVNSSSNYYNESLITSSDVQTICNSAEVIVESTGYVLGTATLQAITISANETGYVASTALPNGYENQEKALIVNCSLSQNDYSVHHKIPATPSIQLQSELVGSNWVPPVNYTPGFFLNLEYDATLFVDNHADDGSCSNGNLTSFTPLFTFNSPFYSDSFSAAGSAYYSSIFYPDFVKSISCTNSGGTTVLFEEFHLSKYDPNVMQETKDINYN